MVADFQNTLESFVVDREGGRDRGREGEEGGVGREEQKRGREW